MIFEHQRFEIWNPLQHPLKHTLADFGYANPALPGVSNVESALNWIMKVLYPNTKPAVATPADLPATGNAINDYRVVRNDGDGKAAAYRYEQREGDVAPLWYKVADMDYSTDSILASLYDVAQDKFIIKEGRQDLDATGTPLTGVFAGQRIWGGTQSGQNLTLDANFKDATGFVQTTNTFRPTAAGLDLGTNASKFTNLFLSNAAAIGDLTVSSGSVISSSNAITFGSNNLTTTGAVNAAVVNASSAVNVASTLSLTSGSITDTTGAINFGAGNLTTSGTLTAASGSALGTQTFTTGRIVDQTGSLSFGANNLATTGTLSAGNATFTRVDAANLRLDGNTLSATSANGSLHLQASGTGQVSIDSPLTVAASATITGGLTVQTSVGVGSLTLANDTVAATGALKLDTSVIQPKTDNLTDLGVAATRFKNAYLAGSIGDGTNAITMASLLSLRDINTGAAPGMSLFYNGSEWLPSTPDTEITHGTLSGLTTGDAGHTQFAMLAGRSGGQTLQGGTAGGQNLVLDSTSSATKGQILLASPMAPQTAPTYSGGWVGTDLGSASLGFRHIYTKGELKGARLENYTLAGLPSPSPQNLGRVAFVTDANRVYVDLGSQWKPVGGGNKFLSDLTFDGTQTSMTVDVSSTITDARTAIWQLLFNANDFARIYCSIKAISASQVKIDTNSALPSGSYRLIGLE